MTSSLGRRKMAPKTLTYMKYDIITLETWYCLRKRALASMKYNITKDIKINTFC